MKLTDYVIDFLVKQKVGKVFDLNGEAVVNLFDSASKHPGMELSMSFTNYLQRQSAHYYWLECWLVSAASLCDQTDL